MGRIAAGPQRINGRKIRWGGPITAGFGSNPAQTALSHSRRFSLTPTQICIRSVGRLWFGRSTPPAEPARRPPMRQTRWGLPEPSDASASSTHDRRRGSRSPLRQFNDIALCGRHRRSECRQRLARHLIGEVEDARGVVFPDHRFRGVRMLQITVTVSANHEKVMEEAQILELEGIAKIHEHTSTLILNVPDQRNDEKVIAALAKTCAQRTCHRV